MQDLTKRRVSLIADEFENEIASFDNEITVEIELPIEQVFLALHREELERIEG